MAKTSALVAFGICAALSASASNNPDSTWNNPDKVVERRLNSTLSQMETRLDELMENCIEQDCEAARAHFKRALLDPARVMSARIAVVGYGNRERQKLQELVDHSRTAKDPEVRRTYNRLASKFRKELNTRVKKEFQESYIQWLRELISAKEFFVFTAYHILTDHSYGPVFHLANNFGDRWQSHGRLSDNLKKSFFHHTAFAPCSTVPCLVFLSQAYESWWAIAKSTLNRPLEVKLVNTIRLNGLHMVSNRKIRRALRMITDDLAKYL